jgi:trehalose synthase
VASRIGCIQEQIEHGVTGLLLDDPSDLAAFGAAVCGLLANPDDARLMGVRAREAIRERFLSVRGLDDYFRLLPRLVLR